MATNEFHTPPELSPSGKREEEARSKAAAAAEEERRPEAQVKGAKGAEKAGDGREEKGLQALESECDSLMGQLAHITPAPPQPCHERDPGGGRLPSAWSPAPPSPEQTEGSSGRLPESY